MENVYGYDHAYDLIADLVDEHGIEILASLLADYAGREGVSHDDIDKLTRAKQELG